MLRRVWFLSVSVVSCMLATGCGAGMTANTIASSYGTLNSGWFFRNSQQRVVEMIESGEADRMIEDGRASVRNTERHWGGHKILIKEFRIQGWLYRVDVHHSIDPAMDVLSTNMRRVEYGPKDRALHTINAVEMADVIGTLRTRSFNGIPETAYRAYVGADGQVHPVRVVTGQEPDWEDESAIDLVLRTENWPMAVMHYRGCRPPGKAKTGKANKPDGRWIVMDPGPAVPVKYFINKDLHGVMARIAFVQAYNTDLLYVP
ncbi:MAG TPA: hypothetical protein VNA25_01485 [Phycisphaerae bacterium]|nr:hypothetical protein [Phycisphaerae bacterium]